MVELSIADADVIKVTGDLPQSHLGSQLIRRY